MKDQLFGKLLRQLDDEDTLNVLIVCLAFMVAWFFLGHVVLVVLGILVSIYVLVGFIAYTVKR